MFKTLLLVFCGPFKSLTKTNQTIALTLRTDIKH